MKFKNYVMPVLLAVALTGCINDADVLDNSGVTPPVAKGDGNIRFSFVVPNSSLESRSAEDSGEYDKGTPAEYKVSKVRIYLFDSETKNIVKSFNVSVGAPDNTNTVVKYPSSDEFKVDPGTYDIYAVANNTTLNPATVEGLLSNVDAVSYEQGSIVKIPEEGFIMTNRGAEASNQSIVIASPETNDERVEVTIKLERVVAKLRVAKSQETAYELKDPNGSIYARVNLSNYRFFNLSRWYYSFRHVATLADGTDDTHLKEPKFLPTKEYFGPIADVNGYAIDPYFFNKTVKGADSFTNQDNYYAQPYIENKPNNITAVLGTEHSVIYSLENCMYRPAQKYGYTTGVVFKAGLTIPTKHVFNEKGENVDPAEYDKLFYFNYNFYTSLKAVHDIGLANVPKDEALLTPEMQKKYGIKIFEGLDNGAFLCYYDYLILHQPTTGATSGVMEFGIVRNNVYSITITDINGLGSGTPDVDPGVDDKYKAYLKVNFEIYPWIVREQEGSLGD